MNPPATRAPVRWPEGAGLALLLVGTFAARWPFRNAPLIRDEGELAHLAQAILGGATPYLDVYNQKTPLVFYALAGVQQAAGEGLAALRTATTLHALATTLVLWWLARRLFGPRAAGITAGAFALMSFEHVGVVHSASLEFFALIFGAATLLAWTHGGARAAFLAGVAAALAYQTKQNALVLPIFLAADFLWHRALALRPGGNAGRGGLRPARELAAATAGFALVTAATLAFFASQGALAAYLECTWSNNFAYVGVRQTGIEDVLPRLVAETRYADLGLWAFGAVGLLALGGRALRGADGESRGSRASGLWILLAGTAGLAVLGGNVVGHYYVPLLLPLSLGVGFAGDALLRAAAAAPARRLAVVALLALLTLPVLVSSARRLADPEATLERIYATLVPAGIAEEVAHALAERTEPGEPVLVVGSEPQIYYHARRPAASRMVFSYPMTGPYRFAADLRREFLAQIGPGGVRWVAYVNNLQSLASSPADGRRFAAEVDPLLEAHYREGPRFRAKNPAIRADMVILYELREAP